MLPTKCHKGFFFFFYRKLSQRTHPTPNILKPLFFCFCFCGIHPALTQLLLEHRLDDFRDFSSKPEHTRSALTPCEMGLAVLPLHISSSLSSGVILYCCCTAQTFFLFTYLFFYSSPVYFHCRGDIPNTNYLNRVASYAVPSLSFSSL